MSRKIFTLILVCCSFALTRAQTLTEGSFPVAGDVFALTYVDTTGFSSGATGTGVSWDYSTLTANGIIEYDTFMDPSITPYAALVPTATIAQYTVIDTTKQYIYYNNNTNVSAFQRLANIIPDTVIYTTEGNQFPYPLSYGDPFSGSYHAHYNAAGGWASETGTISGSADGTGTLTTPLGTFTNVLRTHFVRTEVDTVESGAVAATSVYTYYSWFQPNSYFPIMEYLTNSYDILGHFLVTTTVGYRMGYASSAVNDVQADNTGWMVYPNPASQQTSVIFQPDNSGRTEITLYDMTGRALQQQYAEGASGQMQQVQLNLASIPAGIYTVTIRNNNGMATRKLEVAR